MKLNDLRKQLRTMLEPCSQGDSAFEADCIIADISGLSNSELRLYSDMQLESAVIDKAISFVHRRLKHEPLQYILGKWEFYGREFFVGDGVLIPRPETELLVDMAVNELKYKDKPVCYDLCSGSGCIGITVSKEIPASKVYMLEKSPIAFGYLEKNVSYNRADNCVSVNGDIFEKCPFKEKADIIISNPPYISSDVIPTLQLEVRREPEMALDGGDDGLLFYRAIAEKWIDYLTDDGIVAVEIGEDQGESVSRIFGEFFADVTVIKDYSSNDRIVLAKNKL